MKVLCIKNNFFETTCMIIFMFCISANSIAAGFEAKLMDIHARIYPDNYETHVNSEYVANVPRNYRFNIQLALNSSIDDIYSIKIDGIKNTSGNLFPGKLSVSQLRQITCEGNTQGSMINVPGGAFPDSWIPYLIRKAPFDVLEVIDNTTAENKIKAKSGIVAGALLQFYIPSNCPIGKYTGRIIVSGSNEKDQVELPVSFEVHKAVVSRDNFIDVVHWLSPDPIDLSKDGKAILWWSDKHWELLEKAGKLLYEDGNNMMYTPLVSGEFPLIQAQYKKKKIQFDYTSFDRWISLFDKIGFKYFSGYHLRYMSKNLTLLDTESGKKKSLSNLGINIGCFQETFLKDFNEHLLSIGMHERFLFHLFDEPSGALIDEYKHYDETLRRCMPGIKSIDATNSAPQLFADFVGFQIYNLPGMVLNKNGTVKKRISEGKPVWLYNTTSPFPPYPNRHIDRELTENRLWPLLALKYNCSGYLFWAVNTYRGVPDEYATSLGALPDGRQLHAPGDAWFYYRTTSGLVGSMRMLSFREGLIDVSLLRQLQKNGRDIIKEQLDKLIFPEMELGHNRPWSDYLTRADEIPKGYTTEYKAYHDNRKKVLQLLDEILP